jgi:hypothetical protein
MFLIILICVRVLSKEDDEVQAQIPQGAGVKEVKARPTFVVAIPAKLREGEGRKTGQDAAISEGNLQWAHNSEKNNDNNNKIINKIQQKNASVQAELRTY